MPENYNGKEHQDNFLQRIKQGIILLMGMHSLFLTEGMGWFPDIRERNFSGQEKKNTAGKQTGKI